MAPSRKPRYSRFSLEEEQFGQKQLPLCGKEKQPSRIEPTRMEPSVHVLNLPNEIMESIFKLLPFENVGKLRLVCRHFNHIGSSILNSEFQRIRTKMQGRFQHIKAQMPRRESARRKHPLARESDIVETLHMRLTLLQMTFGKHIERKHCCFFAGEILDEVHKILLYIRATPVLSRAYKVTDELFDLSTMAMEYFKEHIEPTLPEITYFATDFLEYTPSFSSSPKTQLSLMDDPSTSSTCSPTKSSSGITALQPSTSMSPFVRKRLRNLRESVKRNNGQILSLKRELKMTQRRMTNQQKQIHEMKARYEDYDKKFQTSSRKLNAVLQELSRCKTELQYWRSKSPATHCTCGKVTPVFEFKDNDNNDAFLENLEDDLLMKNEEEFKPIDVISDSELTTPLLVVPACHSTPAEVPFVQPEPTCPLKLETAARQHNACSTESKDMSELSCKPLTRSCKRKLNMDSLSDEPTANQKRKTFCTDQ